ncbi:MAG: hypothetical protein ABI220_05120 [Candidatus Saccharimonadales bacterium]
MEQNFWHKQTSKALFPDMAWSRPENKHHAGKLLIIGGNEHGFAAPAEAYSASLAAGAGAVRVVLPSKLQKTVSKIFPEAEYAPSTPSGSFAASSLAVMLDGSAWSDSVLLAGNIGSNSETVALFENFLSKYTGQINAVGDAADLLIVNRAIAQTNTLIVLDLAQSRRLATALRSPKAITSTLNLVQLVETLHLLTTDNKISLATINSEQIIIASAGQVSTSKSAPTNLSLTTLASHLAVWRLQNPAKSFEAMTTAAFGLANKPA